jgi:hypothetical protein
MHRAAEVVAAPVMLRPRVRALAVAAKHHRRAMHARVVRADPSAIALDRVHVAARFAGRFALEMRCAFCTLGASSFCNLRVDHRALLRREAPGQRVPLDTGALRRRTATTSQT